MGFSAVKLTRSPPLVLKLTLVGFLTVLRASNSTLCVFFCHLMPPDHFWPHFIDSLLRIHLNRRSVLIRVEAVYRQAGSRINAGYVELIFALSRITGRHFGSLLTLQFWHSGRASRLFGA